MVHAGMVGITELMMDDDFLAFMESLPESDAAGMSVYEIYACYQRDADPIH